MNYDPYYHHRRSIRLKGYDYSSEGYYFITMCSLGRKKIFANLSVRVGLAPTHQNELAAPSLPQSKNTSLLSSSYSYPFSSIFKLTRIGKIIDNQWKKISDFYNNVILDEFVIMPDHLHGILLIGSDLNKIDLLNESTYTIEKNKSERAPARGAPTRKERSIKEEVVTLGSIIGSFKSLCVTENLKYMKLNSLNETGKIWQRDYYEHIIRNNSELDRIRRYIHRNPYNWLEDKII